MGTYDPTKHHRRSVRLKGYDYTQQGEYSVTLCARNRRHLFGEISDGLMCPSPAGWIVKDCWNEIPAHHAGVFCRVFQLMPNHVHGIIELTGSAPMVHGSQPAGNPVGTRPAVSQQKIGPCNTFGHPVPGSLSTVVRSFKSAVTKRVHEAKQVCGPVWQSGFYDRIIRDDVERFFTEMYIECNPLLWELDARNPGEHSKHVEKTRELLKGRFGLPPPVIECLLTRWGK